MTRKYYLFWDKIYNHFKMLATDVFDAFNDVGFEDKKKLLDVGLK